VEGRNEQFPTRYLMGSAGEGEKTQKKATVERKRKRRSDLVHSLEERK